MHSQPQFRQIIAAHPGATFSPDTQRLLHFGAPAAELAAAANATVVVPLLQLACIEANGADARSFLHGQFTNDLNHLKAGQAQLSAWCSAKGRMLANFIVQPLVDGYRLILAADLQAAMLKRLQMFVLRAQVRLVDGSAASALVGVAGKAAPEALAAAHLPVPEAPLQVAEQDGVGVIRLSPARCLVVAPQTRVADIWPRLAAHAQPAGLPAWEWLDVQESWPWITAATREEFVPQMADLEKLGGVSFHKGCYPGQEVVARTQYLGKVKRHLYRLKSAQPLVPGEELHSPASPDQSAGKVIGCAPDPAGGYVALAVVLASAAADLRQGGPGGERLEAVAVHP